MVFEVGARFAAERYTISTVSRLAFTVTYNGKRTRHDLATWHAWLHRLCHRGPVTARLNGRPLLPLGPAPLTDGAPFGVTADADTDAHDQSRDRLLRSANDTLQSFTFHREPPGPGPIAVRLTRQLASFRVEVEDGGAGKATCTCAPSRFLAAAAAEDDELSPCTHILAVFLSQPDLRFRALHSLL
jgi:hypothetical protein